VFRQQTGRDRKFDRTDQVGGTGKHAALSQVGPVPRHPSLIAILASVVVSNDPDRLLWRAGAMRQPSVIRNKPGTPPPATIPATPTKKPQALLSEGLAAFMGLGRLEPEVAAAAGDE
jgi:hypothetical protein